jgi:hypothetical protein
MNDSWRRFALVCEFLLANIAVFTLWSQVGGQGHLDLLGWYWKLLLGAGLSGAIVGLTRSLMRADKLLGRGTLAWSLLTLALAAAIAAVTIYCHLQEANEESGEPGSTASLRLARDGWT